MPTGETGTIIDTTKTTSQIEDPLPSLDTHVFIPAVLISLITVAFLIFDREDAAIYSSIMIAYITTDWGWLFVIFGFSSFIFALWLGLGRYGHVKLGQEGEEPEFSNISWVAMMFSAGIGIGLVNWAFVEPIHYMIEITTQSIRSRKGILLLVLNYNSQVKFRGLIKGTPKGLVEF